MLSPVVSRALLLSLGASSTNVIGGAATLFAKKGDYRLLVCTVGISAGVMVYVALMDVMRESEAAFERYHKDRSKAAVTTAWCFFAGMVVVYLTRVAKRRLSKLLRRNDGDATRPAPDANGAAATDNERDRDAGADNASQNDDRAAVRTGSPDNATAPSDSVSVPVDAAPDDAGSRTSEVDEDLEEGITLVSKQTVISTVVALLKLAVYNVPEGFVTCVVAIHEPSMGISVALAVALHNVTEGVCIALPIYFKTGSRCKAFTWGLVKGVVQFSGALIGLGVPPRHISDMFFGLVTAFTSGMLVFTALSEILHKARKHDPNDKCTTRFIFVGMFVTAIVLTALISQRHSRYH
ncbi:Zinc/iron permease [Plasmodiophora brassicae]|uniref:Zinc/iron permease n=1 Tax=Plasmodiophora brassicae TaxID=37360 RepID=A0A0G4IGQ6_PLABS|nr:hypothetical protein PBRA_000186 [Plasmodiophora brassicae]